jgi:hypothetical protein
MIKRTISCTLPINCVVVSVSLTFSIFTFCNSSLTRRFSSKMSDSLVPFMKLATMLAPELGSGEGLEGAMNIVPSEPSRTRVRFASNLSARSFSLLSCSFNLSSLSLLSCIIRSHSLSTSWTRFFASEFLFSSSSMSRACVSDCALLAAPSSAS